MPSSRQWDRIRAFSFADWLPRSFVRRQRPLPQRSYVPAVHELEERIALATFNVIASEYVDITLAAALSIANSNSDASNTINLQSSEFSLSTWGLLITNAGGPANKQLTINGLASGTTITPSFGAGSTGNLFEISETYQRQLTVTLHDLNLVGGTESAPAKNALIKIKSGSVIMDNVDVSSYVKAGNGTDGQSSANGDVGTAGTKGHGAKGGAIFLAGGSLTLQNGSNVNGTAVGGTGSRGDDGSDGLPGDAGTDGGSGKVAGDGGEGAGGGVYMTGGDLNILDGSSITGTAIGGRGGQGGLGGDGGSGGNDVNGGSGADGGAGGDGGEGGAAKGGALFMSAGNLHVEDSTVWGKAIGGLGGTSAGGSGGDGGDSSSGKGGDAGSGGRGGNGGKGGSASGGTINSSSPGMISIVGSDLFGTVIGGTGGRGGTGGPSGNAGLGGAGGQQGNSGSAGASGNGGRGGNASGGVFTISAGSVTIQDSNTYGEAMGGGAGIAAMTGDLLALPTHVVPLIPETDEE